MTDLTLLYYSANALPEQSAANFRNELLKTTEGAFPIISVTQKPIDFGKNICVGDIGQSYYNMYKQIHAGLQHTETKYVAMVDDDSLYNMEHFSYRPTSDDVFSYNKSMWFLDKTIFWTKDHAGGFSSIAPTKFLRDILGLRLTRFPEEPMPRNYQKYQWLEPGHEEPLGFRAQKMEYFKTKTPLITLCYWDATSGWPKRRQRGTKVAEELEYWGNAQELRNRLIGA
jgi:hypothetical protein